ncbi:MAG: hydrolase [Halorhabdus sp.]
MLDEWHAGAVTPSDELPEPETWEPVTVPGKPSAFAGADAVAYRSEFDDPRPEPSDGAMLVLEGLYARARVWLNGSLLAEHDAYFEPLSVRLGEHLAPENELVVECRRPDRFGGIYESDLVPAEASVPGIWWDATVEPYHDHHILNLAARPRLNDDGASFEVQTTVVTDRDLEDRLTFSVKPEGERRGRGMMNRGPVDAQAGERTTVEHTIEIRDPALWWPHDVGSQDRYVVRVKLGDEERTLTTGLCSTQYDETDGLLVNGQSITGRGVNLLDAEPADIERAVDVNANLVRTHAHVPHPAVLSAADDAGVLVWSDLPLTGPGPFDPERGRDLVTGLVGTYGSHPSLAAVGVHDDPITLGDGSLGSGAIDRLRLRYRLWRASYDREAAAVVADAVPESLLTFSVIGPPGIDADATTLYPGWRYGSPDDVEWLLDRYPHLGEVVAEYGVASLGSDPDAQDTSGFDRAVHDRYVEDGRSTSQVYQRDALVTITEQLRRRESSLFVATALRDTAGAGMGVYTDDGEPKAARNALQTAFEPIQTLLVVPQAGAESGVIAVNDTPQATSGTLSWEAGNTSGTCEVSLDGNETTQVTTVDVPTAADAVELSLSLSDRTITNTYQL